MAASLYRIPVINEPAHYQVSPNLIVLGINIQ